MHTAALQTHRPLELINSGWPADCSPYALRRSVDTMWHQSRTDVSESQGIRGQSGGQDPLSLFRALCQEGGGAHTGPNPVARDIPPKRRRSAGFTLLEIVIAVGIMGMGLVGFFSLFNGAQVQMRRAEALTQATMLARHKMAELLLDLEKRVAEGKFPESDETPECQFEGEEHFRCEIEIKKVEIPMPPGQDGGGGNPLELFMKQLQLDEAVREVRLVVTWDVRGHERELAITTHVVKL